MLYVYDCEFIEDGYTIDLVSIGIVAEDGRKYYAVNRNVSWEKVHRRENVFVRENVWKHLPTNQGGGLSLDVHHVDVRTKQAIAHEVKNFLLDTSKEISLWADYCSYDHVALCQLWGRMVDLPRGIPMRTNDIIQRAEVLGIKEIQFPSQDPATMHHALHDAEHNMTVMKFLEFEAYPQRFITGQEV